MPTSSCSRREKRRIYNRVRRDLGKPCSREDPLYGYSYAAQLRQAVKNASCLVFPSLYEGFGLPPLEALACGTPVLASDIPPVRETCADAADYFDPHSESSLREGLLRCAALSADPEAREARRRRAALFSWDRTAALTVSALKQAFGL